MGKRKDGAIVRLKYINFVKERLISSDSINAAEATLEVWIDQELCTGDGLCVQYARPVFEMDLDGLAYVKDEADELLLEPGARTRVPLDLVTDVIASAKECPGNCIHVAQISDGKEIAGPNAS